MATQDYAASIQGVSIRVTRLDANGNLLNGAGDSYTTSAFMRVSFTPEYEEGDEITEKSASGAICVSYKAPDTLKRITMELAICEPDPELTNLIAGGLLLRKNLGTFSSPNKQSIGWAAPNVGDYPQGNGVALEVWSLAIKDGKKAGTLPYFKWVFPYVKLRQSGDRVIENGVLANTFQGYGLGNILYSTGPDGRWEFPVASERPYSYARDSWAPNGRKGFYTWHPTVTKTVAKVARAAGIATITTADAHGFQIGDTVTIAGVTNDTNSFNGTFTVLASGLTSTAFTVANTAGTASVTEATATGTAPTASIPAGSREVGTLPDANTTVSVTTDGTTVTTTTSFNVPGAKNYNPDLPSDYIVGSAVDPTA
jgi:hypothetical protein